MSESVSNQSGLEYTQRLLACLVYELQANWFEKVDEDPPDDLFERLEVLVKRTPPEVMALVEYLKRNPPQAQPGELYTYAFPSPFIQWRNE